jgi:hypothetical protein
MNQKSFEPRAMIRQSGNRVFGPQVQGPWTLDKVSRSRDRGVFLYLKGNLIYVGETISFLKSRHLREDIIQAGDFDCVKILKASKNTTRRRYWEAVLVLKLKPSQQSNISKYIGLVKKINNNEFVKTPVENKEKGFEKVLDNNKLEMKIIAYRHLMEFKKYMEAVN